MRELTNGRADLHLHSNLSDGIYSPQQLFKLAAQAGLKAAALTDHDTMEGVDAGLASGLQYGIEIVPGVEISAFETEREIHLLGYYPTYPDDLKKELSRIQRGRFERMERILDRLNRFGFRLSLDQICKEAAPAAPGRLHLARHMVANNLVNSLEQAFTLYLERGKPAYVPRINLTPIGALHLLLETGTVPVLAHPGLSSKAILPELAAFGLQGVEVFHPEHSTAQRRYYRQAAEAYNLLITGGSDFHGDQQYRARSPGSVSIPYHYLEKLKAVHFG